ncbi:hypothetical protein [Cellulomonas sp. RIT-PI-Y]|uniref:hypothetical protein n=1 Tax=Cellulomonas sp. RIT-PI-Y TaxID=3035297 RepID=UPI0021DACAE6|nr:hypothetical protein [Cellulomonas sp. RIT-PI-Y]
MASATTTGGIVVPAGIDPFDPQGDMVEMGESIDPTIIHIVTNLAARTQLAAALSPTPARPLYVHRQDTLDAAHLESSTDGTTWATHFAPPALPTPTSTTANGSETSAGNLIRDDKLGGFTFPALAGCQYRVACDSVLLNGTAVGDIYSAQLRIIAGTALPGGTATLVAATQATVGAAGSAGRQPIDLSGPWTCPSTGQYTVAFFLQRNAAGTGVGTPVSSSAPRTLYAHLTGRVA